MTQRPDIALEVQFSDGSHLVYIFDPKYKFESEEPENIDRESKPKRQDIDKMHTYCHAIRDNEGRQVVNYAAILYPGSYIPYPDAQIEALRAYPGAEAELRIHLHRILSKALNSDSRSR
ncbi:nuclease domain-containing protein [uncultured Nostoc sp.]|uniref:nuclease domain-containing protein n=1 Tax=uncultured Nostoc sp. TaxID=340711 RepID=UPI0035C9CFBC